MKRQALRVPLAFAAFSLVVIALCAALGLFVYGEAGNVRRSDANNVLASFQQTMTLKLRGELGMTGDVAAALAVDPQDEAWLPSAASTMLERDEVVGVLYVVGDTMRYAFPEDDFGDMVGRDLSQFSYVFTLAKWIDDFVVEGPVTIGDSEESFLFIEPVDVGGAYYGEVAVALRAGYVVDQLDLSMLEESGYLYELWAVSPQDGRKDVIAVSEGGHDFSHAAKTSFDMPSAWTLSIMPRDGWVPRLWTGVIAAGVTLLALLIIGCVGLGLKVRRMRNQIAEERRIDQETGLLTFAGFVEVSADAETRGRAAGPLTIVCLTVDNFERMALALGWDERLAYLSRVCDEIDSVVRSEHVCVRLSAGSFAVAIHERVNRHELVDLMRALELELMWKGRIDGKKAFCRVRSAAVRYPEDGADLTALIERTMSLLERDGDEAFERGRRG